MMTSASPAANPATRKSFLPRLAHIVFVSALASLTLGAGPVTFQPVGLVYRQMEGTFLKGPRGVFVDTARGEVYVADTQNDLVAVYGLDGVPRFAFGYNGELKEPIKAVTDERGQIYVLTGRAIKIFNYRGEYLKDFPFLGLDRPPLPTAITAAKGELYIADGTSGQVLVYDSDFRLKRRFGGERIKSASAMTVAPDGTVYLADANGPTALQVYAADGSFVRGWGAHENGPQNFSLPSGIAVDGEGRIIAVDMLRQQISIFTAEGGFQSRFGGLGTALGAVSYPSDVASDGNGRLYVVERQGNRLQIFQARLESGPRSRPASGAPATPAAVRDELRRAFGDVMKAQ